ncbi:MAG: hypothetical protein UV73_C0003G0172 [Candidatus Gottesmanbacteria bacterium GW2011_GWA2_43_14]|uniref:Uncharacterized protein n=1 Tax=Candidatus Gottesmanbacteria bacterium GW2011_GWA2_43_14 TaxID=1618443 RepID=A0A0G1DK60_9BACT|nr:MAG: hypothetical protein UV73_C0003G0172 [Candidatus Gottesmanbacteria bacterium GW2011_GWA2_43_14]
MNRKELYILAIITFSTVVAWVVFGVYHAKYSDTTGLAEAKKTEALTPNFDMTIIGQLQGRREINYVP